MKKTLLLMCVLMASAVGTWAQTNLALNKTAVASSVSDENDTFTADKAVDGNTDTKWASNYGTKSTLTDDEKSQQYFYVQLGDAAVSMNAVTIQWDNQPASSFDIRYTDELPSTVNYSNLSTTGTVVLENQTGGSETKNVYKFASTVSAKYIILVFKTRGTSWGYGIREFGVYNETYAVSSISATIDNTTLAVGGTATVSYTAYDQIGDVISTSVTYDSSNTDVATVENGTVTAKAAGTANITVKSGEVTSNILALTVLTGSKISISTDAVFPIEDTQTSSKTNAFDADLSNQWELHASQADVNYNCGFIVDLKGVYNVSAISIKFEGACSADYTIAVAGSDGTLGSAAYTVSNHAGMTTYTVLHSDNASATSNVRYIKFLSTKAATGYGIKIMDFTVYGTNTSTIENSTIPTIPTYSVSDKTADSFKVTLNSTATSGKYVNYNISYSTVGGEATTLQLSGESATNMEHTFSGLTAATTYTFNVTAVDAFGLSSSAAAFNAATMGADETAPVFNSASLNSTSATSATLALKATDETSSTVTYQVIDTTNGIDVTSDAQTSGEEYDFTINGLTPGTTYTFTIKAADASGNTATYASTIEATTTALSAPVTPTKFAANVYSLYSDAYTTATCTIQPTWDGGITASDVEVSTGENIKKGENWNSLAYNGLAGATLKSLDVKKFHFDIYPVDKVAGIKVYFTDAVAYDITGITAGEWNSFDIDLTTTPAVGSVISDVSTIGHIKIRALDAANGTANNETKKLAYFDNIFFYAEPADIAIAYGEADGNGVVAVTGTLNSMKLSDFNAALTGVAYNLTGMTIAEDVTIKAANENAILIMTETQRSALSCDKTNMVVRNAADTQYEGIISITDQENANIFATGLTLYATSMTYTRKNIAADKYVTVALPFVPTATVVDEVSTTTGITSGFSGYYPEAAPATGSITFNKTKSWSREPYIIHNTNETATDFVATAENVLLNFESATVRETFVSVFTSKTLTSDGSKTYYVLKGDAGSATFKKANGVGIGAFRGYLETTTGGAHELTITFDDGETTSVATINAQGEIEKAEVYNLSGQRVANPTKGLYIVNGKKVIIK